MQLTTNSSAIASTAPQPNWPQRQKPSLVRLSRKWLIKAGVVVLFGGFASAGYYYFPKLTAVVRGGVVQWSEHGGMGLKQILVTGRKHLGSDELYRALDIYQGMSLLTMDLPTMRERLIATPWVRDAVIVKKFPDQLQIILTEAEPFLLWLSEGKYTLLDRQGMPIEGVDITQYQSLPVISGLGAPTESVRLFAMLQQQPTLYARVKGAAYISMRRWDIGFDNGVVVKMPETGIESAWAMIANLDAQKQILNRSVSVIDLRLPDKVVVEMETSPLIKPAAAKATGNPI